MTDKQKHIINKKLPLSGDLADPITLEQAARALCFNEPIVVDNGSVFAICFNGADPDTVERVYEIKKRPKSQAFAFTRPTNWFTSLVDVEQVAPDVQPLLVQPQELKKRTSGLLFVRAPLKQTAVAKLPSQFVSYDARTRRPIIQNYDPDGKTNFARLLVAAESFAKLHGLPFLAGCTSYNISGQPEIVEPTAARKLARKLGLAFLADTQSARRSTGSYGILEFTDAGLYLRRQPNVPVESIMQLFSGYTIKKEQSSYVAAKHIPLRPEDLPQNMRSLSIDTLKRRLLEIIQ